MTFKEFMKKVYSAPADAFEFINRVLFGYTGTNVRTNKPETKPGLFTLVLAAANWLLTGISNFVSNHKQAIATAFWASLAVAGAAALTVALWPAALAAVTGFTVFGLSIAAVVGTGFVAQVAATAGVAAALTSAAVYTGAAVVNMFSALIGRCCKPKEAKGGKGSEARNTEDNGLTSTESRAQFTGLGRKSPHVDTRNVTAFSYTDSAPLHTSVFQTQPVQTGPKQPVVSDESRSTLTNSQ